MTNETKKASQLNIDIAIYVSDAVLQQNLVTSIGESASRNNGIVVRDLKSSKALGSFDLPFYISLIISIPLGLGINLVSAWLWERIHKSKIAHSDTTIKVHIASQTIRITDRSDYEIVQITQAIEIEAKRETATGGE